MKAIDHHIESLDAFRGATIVAMILVNNPGNWNAVFPPLMHADWNGFTLADAIFPAFVFIMGVAMPFAFARRKHTTSVGLYVRVLRRGAVLVALGLALNAVAAFPHVGALRIPGVLQRIGVVYVIAAAVVLNTSVAAQAVVATALIGVHWALLVTVPFGGHAAGDVTRASNLAGYVDLRVFGHHMLTPLNDPEGLLGTLTSVATALCGALAGWWIRRAPRDQLRVNGLMAAGTGSVLVGLLWSHVWPLNKPLWTGSYVLVTAGMSAMVLAGFYALIEGAHARRWAHALVWLGANPLTIYFLSELTAEIIERPWIAGGAAPKDFVFWSLVAPLVHDGGGVASSFLFALSYAALWVGVAGALYRRGIHIHV
ncbi:MAG TPA: heparan-alpha-glucosaminide N-acetyltransferase domain-containing protein [Vicinamibacterales bacterium]|nr:heparan-alpha-glucosaminide N-acetyltransferase domain-containing protein [Vicinamibacterales bacterium]